MGSSLENHEVIGFDEEAEKVIKRLVEGSEYLDVIQVVGFTKRLDEFQDKNEAGIAKEIRDRVANGGKCLIVLDDVWDSDIVHFIKKVFPENNIGHRIIMTTRHKDVARFVNAEPHKLKFLNPKESFQLIEKRDFTNSRCPVEFVEHGQGIVEK
ncbi:hypothetical protein HAX54_026290 [Datura stramonium]|uniref:NB-ARC domain-containing protein n=1 Tax=Datura stramonium TaxID=4076 RepID=A0ABS8V2H9_DATST|nr:hypothetical protein [Datura stramonium]